MRDLDNGLVLGLPLNVLVGLAMAMSALSGGLGLAMRVPEPGRYAAMAGVMSVVVVGLLMMRGSDGYAKLMDSMRTHPLPWLGIGLCFIAAMGLVFGVMNGIEEFVG